MHTDKFGEVLVFNFRNEDFNFEFMKTNLVVERYDWHDDGFVSLHFAVYKKGLFGGMKFDRRFWGWSLNFQVTGGEVDVDFVQLQDGNFQQQPFQHELVSTVLAAGSLTLEESGEPGKADI